MHNFFAKLSVAVMATSMAATVIVPKAYEMRGYWGVGGEWVALVGILILAYNAAGTIF
jgi:hypothetical protein